MTNHRHNICLFACPGFRLQSSVALDIDCAFLYANCQVWQVKTCYNSFELLDLIHLAWKCQSFNFHIYNIKSIKFISRGRYSTCAVSFVDTLYIIGNLIVQEMHCRIYTQKIFKRRSNQPWWTREYQPE